MSDKETIEKLTQEVISLRKQVDSLTPKLYRVKAWHKVRSRSNDELIDRTFIDRTYKCYSYAQADAFIDSFASKNSWSVQSIYTSVEQIDFKIIEDDWVNQLAKKIIM
jgi:hypothetical protein